MERMVSVETDKTIGDRKTLMQSMHRRWRLVVFLPMIYLLAGLYFWKSYLVPKRGGEGFIPLNHSVYILLICFAALAIIFLWKLLLRLEFRFFQHLSEMKFEYDVLYPFVRDRQMLQFSICELAAYPGIIIFLMDGKIAPLIFFIFISMIFYLRIIPLNRRLEMALQTSNYGRSE